MALPYGGHRWIRIHVWRAPKPRAQVEVRDVRWRTDAFGIENAEFVRSEAELSEEVRAEILALLDARSPLSSRLLRAVCAMACRAR